MGKPSKKEARRQARLERRAVEAQQRHQQRRTRTAAIAGIVALVVVVAGWAAWRAMRPAAPISGPSQETAQPAAAQIVTVSDQGRDHISPGASHPPYTSNPPASGWHYPTAASWGFYNSELPDELLVHNLEHGGIWISFKDDTDAEVVDALVALAREYRTKVIVTHRPKNDSRIAVVAWDHVMKLDRFDRGAIVDFINRFKNKGPEFVPD